MSLQCRYASPVWVTSRSPRVGEQDGVDFTFIEDFAFEVIRESGRFLVTYRVSCLAAQIVNEDT
jgi:guanylate kinase